MVQRDQLELQVPKELQVLLENREKQVQLVLQERKDGEVSGEFQDCQEHLEPLELLVLMVHEVQLDAEDTLEPEVKPAQTVPQEPLENPEHQDQLETPELEVQPEHQVTEDQKDHQGHEVHQAQPFKSTSTHQKHFHLRAQHTVLQNTTTTTTTITTNTTTHFTKTHERLEKISTCSISSMGSRSKCSEQPNPMAALSSQPNPARISKCASLKPLQENTGSIPTVETRSTRSRSSAASPLILKLLKRVWNQLLNLTSSRWKNSRAMNLLNTNGWPGKPKMLSSCTLFEAANGGT